MFVIKARSGNEYVYYGPFPTLKGADRYATERNLEIARIISLQDCGNAMDYDD